MKVVGFGELSAQDLETWHRLRQADPALDSPYFHPNFSRAVHEVAGDVQVVVADGGVLAVQVDAGVARPVGWPGADFQGPIGPGIEPAAALAALGARSLEFDHLVDGHPAFEPWIEGRRISPYVETDGGLDGYLKRASKSGRDNMAQARRRTAKAGRELGALRFEADLPDPAVLDQVIELKRGQYRATGARDYFAVPGRRELLHRLLAERSPEFGGVLSAVFAGDRLFAAHFGIRSGGVLHWWFPVYEPSFGNYAPGWVLLRELVSAAPASELVRIDLGRGEDEYKRRAMTGHVEVCQGMVASRARRGVRRAGLAVRSAIKESPVGPHAKAVLRKLRSR
ncbi:GNAT family N-acetyltransferase [Labedaea rhizosphaerae]|uniref:CelD/BcsL family acetyltransferase involved in cellulose biosynthesis n=1 Tax=Labedaea rhizosphaerae TaxID=598644 RepID=A0A4V3D0E6_LABRH|nr:GNAT family N-acetyltransferase [Labedaea rhizosphaerae]TDQ05525.1 CelD/BcsL family acetyltransferase involved in cellulose biosynthesis [Labedaea rhizosphaerae]